jgi:hypothetical protein
MGQVGCVYLNFGLWGISLAPAWLVIKKIGVSIGELTDKGEVESSTPLEASEDVKLK